MRQVRVFGVWLMHHRRSFDIVVRTPRRRMEWTTVFLFLCLQLWFEVILFDHIGRTSHWPAKEGYLFLQVLLAHVVCTEVAGATLLLAINHTKNTLHSVNGRALLSSVSLCTRFSWNILCSPFSPSALWLHALCNHVFLRTLCSPIFLRAL